MTAGEAIANRRFVLMGRRDDGRVAPLLASDDRGECEAEQALGRQQIAGRWWTPTLIHDRRQSIMPAGGWYSEEVAS